MRPLRRGSGGSGTTAAKAPKRAQFADVRFQCGGGGAQAVELWYPRRLNDTILNDLATALELVEHDIATFVAAAPGSITIAGDVTALYPAGRPCDIRDPAHTGGNDNFAAARPYIVASSVFAAGFTTITWEADAASYRVGTIVADVAGTSKLTSTLFKCLTSGTYRLSSIAGFFAIDQSALRLVNVSGFSYGVYSGVTAEGGTVWASGLATYANTVPSLVYWDEIVDLVAGEYYEMQQWADGAGATENALGYDSATVPDPIWHHQVVIEEYDV